MEDKDRAKQVDNDLARENSEKNEGAYISYSCAQNFYHLQCTTDEN